jgi:UPF0755 protein
MIYESEEGLMRKHISRGGKFAIFLFLILAFASVLCVYEFCLGPLYFKAPIDSKLGGVIVKVVEGEDLGTLASDLKVKGVITSANLFKVYAKVLGYSKSIIPGAYLFKSPTGIAFTISRFTRGDFGIPLIKITFPEGFTLEQITARLEANLPLFDKNKFARFASSSEGYLFPETYFFMPGVDEKKIYTSMILMFKSKTEKLWGATTTEEEKDSIVKMASIIEKEVRNPEDMKVVSGIFWKRIKLGMPLQADSTLAYERNKTSAELTLDDLKLDTTYNSYTRKGLPPTAIDNPGLNAIDAAANPIDSKYLYFLTGKDGKVYYAKTLAEHVANKKNI